MDLFIPILGIIIVGGMGLLLLLSGLKVWRGSSGSYFGTPGPIQLLIGSVQLVIGVCGIFFAITQIIVLIRSVFSYLY